MPRPSNRSKRGPTQTLREHRRTRRRRVLLNATAEYDPVYTEDEPVVPTRWVKFVFGVFLLPVTWVWLQSFFAIFARTTIHDRFWATEEFWFFGLGLVLWVVTFFGLPRPILMYVFGHELTHALWVWIMGGRVSQFRISRDGGSIATDRINFLIALSPYFFPIYTLLAILVFGVASLFTDVSEYRRLLFAILGITWGFHATFTLWMIPKGQSDLRGQGTFFSLVLILLMNLIVVTVFLVAASPQVTWAGFGAELVRNASNFAAWICSAPILPGN
jgi:hypothetical protein